MEEKQVRNTLFLSTQLNLNYLPNFPCYKKMKWNDQKGFYHVSWSPVEHNQEQSDVGIVNV